MTLNYLKNKKYYILASLFCLCYALGPEKVEVTCHKAITSNTTNANPSPHMDANPSLVDKKWRGEAVGMLTIGAVIATVIVMVVLHAAINKDRDQRTRSIVKKEMGAAFPELKEKAEVYQGLVKSCFDYVNTLHTSPLPVNIVEGLAGIKEGQDLIKQCLHDNSVATQQIRETEYQVSLSENQYICIRDVYKAMRVYTLDFYKKQEVNNFICTGYWRQKDKKIAMHQYCVSIIATYTEGQLDPDRHNEAHKIELFVEETIDTFAGNGKSKIYSRQQFYRQAKIRPNKSIEIYGQEFTDIVERLDSIKTAETANPFEKWAGGERSLEI